MGLPRMGGQGGHGGDVWVVAKKDLTLKRIKDKFPSKRFVAGVGGNSRCVFTFRATYMSHMSFLEHVIFQLGIKGLAQGKQISSGGI